LSLYSQNPTEGLSQEELQTAHFSLHLSGANQLTDEQFKKAIEAVSTQVAEQATELVFQSTLAEQSNLYQRLTKLGFTIKQTDRYFSIPCSNFKHRSHKLYQKIKDQIPQGVEDRVNKRATLMIRNFLIAQCGEELPKIFTCRADSSKHKQLRILQNGMRVKL